MTITITIDTHPHTNALIEGQVRAAVEAALQQAKWGTVVAQTPSVDLTYVAQLLREADSLLPDSGNEAEDKVQEALEYLKGF